MSENANKIELLEECRGITLGGGYTVVKQESGIELGNKINEIIKVVNQMQSAPCEEKKEQELSLIERRKLFQRYLKWVKNSNNGINTVFALLAFLCNNNLINEEKARNYIKEASK